MRKSRPSIVKVKFCSVHGALHLHAIVWIICTILRQTLGAPFTNDFSIAIHIRWKICFSVTPLKGIILLQHSFRVMWKILWVAIFASLGIFCEATVDANHHSCNFKGVIYYSTKQHVSLVQGKQLHYHADIFLAWFGTWVYMWLLIHVGLKVIPRWLKGS